MIPNSRRIDKRLNNYCKKMLSPMRKLSNCKVITIEPLKWPSNLRRSMKEYKNKRKNCSSKDPLFQLQRKLK